MSTNPCSPDINKTSKLASGAQHLQWVIKGLQVQGGRFHELLD
jgi:hypothetical protein